MGATMMERREQMAALDKARQAIALGQAIKRMADLYAKADRDYTFAYSQHLRANITGPAERAAELDLEWRRLERTAMRRRAALGRLVDALKRMATN